MTGPDLKLYYKAQHARQCGMGTGADIDKTVSGNRLDWYSTKVQQ